MAAGKQKKDQESTKVPDFRTIEVVLTYEGYPPMEFSLRRSLGHELRAVQREFFGKEKIIQGKEQQAYRVQFLSSLLRKAPTNVPSYPETSNFKADFKSYFGDEEMDDMVDHIWVAYQNKIYPKELTSNTSE